MRILFDVAGEKLVNRRILRVGERAVDATEAFVAIGELMMSETGIQFATEGTHASGGWKHLKPATIAAKQRDEMRTEILRRTDDLLHSLTVKGDTNMVFEAHPTELIFGSKLPYALVHQNPRPTNPHKTPKRPPLAFTNPTRVEIVKILQRFLMTGVPA